MKDIDLKLKTCLDNFDKISEITSELNNNINLIDDDAKNELSQLADKMKLEFLPEIERLKNNLKLK